MSDNSSTENQDLKNFEEESSSKRYLSGWNLKLVGIVAISWTLFQLWYASPFPFIFNFGQFIDVPARAIHLCFGLTLCFLIYPSKKKLVNSSISIKDFIFVFLSIVVTLYLVFDYEGLVNRQGILAELKIFGFNIQYELIMGGIGILLLLEATRRAIGLPLVIIAIIFLLFSYFGRQMPELISHAGLSLKRLVGYHWLGGEAIFGIPISVSVSFIFLFVLFGAILDTAGGGKYFLNLAFALVGRMRGGPAKAAILASGLTGMISGSSVANTVTTGTFTIPIMKKTGLPAIKAGAVEVAASVNGQIMPPIMGAAAFLMAEIHHEHFQLQIQFLDWQKARLMNAMKECNDSIMKDEKKRSSTKSFVEEMNQVFVDEFLEVCRQHAVMFPQVRDLSSSFAKHIESA